MAAAITQLRPSRSEEETLPATEVVAVILSDGSIVEMPAFPRELIGRPDASDWAQGSISGQGWIVWWERRRYGEPGS